ncbi:MAG: porin [Gammaproteobacteria bacterium]|nr:porin [Gammaproteobacteria bacterium]MBV8306366.1 porin [Gammaproteobacteria bacterium]
MTWKGITLYGIVDIGVQYQTHGVPASDYFPAGTEAIIQKNSQGSVTAVTPSNLQQSRIGLSGNEPLIGDWAGVFRLEVAFNPQSGNISDALKSITLNNGVPVTKQTTNVDSSLDGQLFGAAAFLGFSSPTVGSFTFGRHVTNLADGIAKYDPQGAAQAFSLIGFSGTTAGGGDTEDRRLDNSLKYVAKYGWLHLGGLYQFSQSSGSVNSGYQVQLGADFAGLSVDGYYFKKYNAVAAAPLSAAQVTELQTGTCNPPVTVPPTTARCSSISNSVAATVSDNKVYAVMGLYDFGASVPIKLYAGYEHITYENPNTPYEPGQSIEGGYIIAFPNNTAYGCAVGQAPAACPGNKILKVYWGGIKWSLTPAFDLTAAYYGYKQDAYAGGKNAGCSSRVAGSCSGTEESFSLVADYRLSKRFDVFLGTFYTGVSDGLASPAPPEGYFYTSTITTTAGVRFKF